MIKYIFSKVAVALAFITLLNSSSFGQQRPVISQYMFSGLVLNPAYAGRHEYTSFSAMYRNQWVNVPGSPELGTLTAQTGFKDRRIGLGLLISDDKLGVHDNVSVYTSYAYYIKFPNGGKFSMGLQGGFDYYKSDWSKLYLLDDDDPILTGAETNLFPNFGTGAFYFDDHLYVGISVPYILKTRHQISLEDIERDVRHTRSYYVTAGRIFDLSPKLKLKPSVLIRMDENQPVGFDINGNIYYDEIIDFGFSYRQQDSFIVLMGMQLNKYLKFSYAYDYIISNLNNYTRGTHELMLQYRINFNAPKHHRMCPQPQYF